MLSLIASAALVGTMNLEHPATVGGQINFSLQALPNQEAALWFGLEELPGGLEIPTIGTLKLSPPFITVANAQLNAKGRGKFVVPVPDEPALAGLELLFQGWFYDDFGIVKNSTLSELELVTIQP